MNLIKSLFPTAEIAPPKIWQVHVFAGMGVLLSFLRGVHHQSMLSFGVTVALGLCWLFQPAWLAKLLFFLVKSSLVFIQAVALAFLAFSFFTVISLMHAWLFIKKTDPLQRKWTSDASYLEAPEKFADDLFSRPF